MKNREKYEQQMLQAIREGEFINFFETCIMPDMEIEYGGIIRSMEMAIITMLWLDKEYKEPKEPAVDWSKVEVDTPIYVRAFPCKEWDKGHFAKYENGKVCIWCDCRTSWTVEDPDDYVGYEEGKLAEER